MTLNQRYHLRFEGLYHCVSQVLRTYIYRYRFVRRSLGNLAHNFHLVHSKCDTINRINVSRFTDASVVKCELHRNISYEALNLINQMIVSFYRKEQNYLPLNQTLSTHWKVAVNLPVIQFLLSFPVRDVSLSSQIYARENLEWNKVLKQAKLNWISSLSDISQNFLSLICKITTWFFCRGFAPIQLQCQMSSQH